MLGRTQFRSLNSRDLRECTCTAWNYIPQFPKVIQPLGYYNAFRLQGLDHDDHNLSRHNQRLSASASLSGSSSEPLYNKKSET